MTLAIVGIGLVSPFGFSPREHVFLGRVGLPAPPPAAFANADGEPLRAYHARFVDLRAPLEERLVALAMRAVDEALGPIAAALPAAAPSLALAVPAARPGITARILDEVERALGARLRPAQTRRFPGETGAFAALAEINSRGPGSGLWIVVAVDSFLSAESLAHLTAVHPRSRWVVRRPHPSEAAAVLVVADVALADDRRLPLLGKLEGVSLAHGSATDENDEPTDGWAMTEALRAVLRPNARLLVGQSAVDALRRRDILLATAREASKLRAGWQDECLEAKIGCVGAAIGGASVAYGLCLVRHHGADMEPSAPPAFAAWAIDRDGTRAAAAFQVEMGGRARAEPLATKRILAARAVVSDPAPIELPEGDAGEPETAPTAEADAAGAAAVPDAPPSSARVRMLETIVEDDARAEEAERAAREALAWERRPRPPFGPDEALSPPPVPVRLVGHVPVLSAPALRGHFVWEILEDIAVRGRNRRRRPLAEREDIEASLVRLADAAIAMGNPFQAIDAWWKRSLDPDDPWPTFAATFALSAFDDAGALDHLRTGLERLGDTALHAEAAAAALAFTGTPAGRTLAPALAASQVPAARAVGIDVLTRAGALSSADLTAHLASGGTSIARAVIGVSSRWDAAEAPALVQALLPWVRAEDTTLALAACVALLRMGHRAPLDELRAGGPLAARLGPAALEVLALAGGPQDLPLIERSVASAPADGAMLSALARFGHPGVWAFLLHCLGDEELEDDAESALRELFGNAVQDGERRSVAAWREAITRLRPDPSVRCRRGVPWQPRVLAEECLSGALSASEADARVAELQARLALRVAVDFALPKRDVDQGLAAFWTAADRAREVGASGWPSR